MFSRAGRLGHSGLALENAALEGTPDMSRVSRAEGRVTVAAGRRPGGDRAQTGGSRAGGERGPEGGGTGMLVHTHTPSHTCTHARKHRPTLARAHSMWPVDTHASHTHLHAQTYMHTRTNMHPHVCAHTHVLTHIHTHILAHSHAHARTLTHNHDAHAHTTHTYPLDLTRVHVHTTYACTRTLKMHAVAYTDQPRPPRSHSRPRTCRGCAHTKVQPHSHTRSLRAAEEPFIH